MNRQEAIDFIHQTAQHLERLGEHNPAKALEIALETILSTPDPITGLVPCGCGEKMRIDIPPGNDSVRARWRKLTSYSVGIEPVEYHYTCRVCRKHFWNYDCKDTELQKFIQKGGRGMSKNDWRQKATWFFVGLLIGIAFLLLKRWLTI